MVLMNIILKNFVIIISPIFYHYPQIKQIIYNKSDLGFSSERLTLNYCSIFIEMILNLSSNKDSTTKSTLIAVYLSHFFAERKG